MTFCPLQSTPTPRPTGGHYAGCPLSAQRTSGTVTFYPLHRPRGLRLGCCSRRVRACVGVGGVFLCVCVCVCDLLIFLHRPPTPRPSSSADVTNPGSPEPPTLTKRVSAVPTLTKRASAVPKLTKCSSAAERGCRSVWDGWRRRGPNKYAPPVIKRSTGHTHTHTTAEQTTREQGRRGGGRRGVHNWVNPNPQLG